MVFMPPRHGKSELVSRYFPAWAFGRHPDLSMIASSYADDLISRMNRDVQRIIDSPRYRTVFPEIGLNAKNIRTTAQGTYLRNSDIFEIVGNKGVYRSAGVGAGITGMGADILNIDDPVKDAKEANSETVRKSVWEWYTSTAYTRLSPGGGVLLTMTRWHVDDLAGRLLEAMRKGEGDQWKIINFPAIAVADEPNRRAGEALHPERWPLDYLDSIKRTVGEYNWQALYQQSPTTPGGSIIKKDQWRWYDLEEERKNRTFSQWAIFLTADTAFKKGEDNDRSVFQAWCATPERLLLLGGDCGKWEFPELKERAKVFYERWAVLQPQRRVEFFIEDKASGTPLVQVLNDAGIPVVPWTPKEYKFPDGKVERMNASSLAMYAGAVYVPKGDVYSDILIDEAAAFTWNDAHLYDDNCDAFTMAVSVWIWLGGNIATNRQIA